MDEIIEQKSKRANVPDVYDINMLVFPRLPRYNVEKGDPPSMVQYKSNKIRRWSASRPNIVSGERGPTKTDH